MADMEYGKACALCGQDDPAQFKIYYDGHLKLFTCKKCGLVGQFPGPGGFKAVTDYEVLYTVDQLNDGSRDFFYPECRSDMVNICERIIRLKPNGKLLDVGCGDGQFVTICKERGMDVCGIEPSKEMAVHVPAKWGIDVAQGIYSADKFPPNSFDVITFIQVMEHVFEPREVLAAVKQHLKPGGLLVIEVPSIRAPHFLAYKFTRLKPFIGNPSGVQNYHVSYFSPKTLEALTRTCGFSTVQTVTGRWKTKYTGGAKGMICAALDPMLNALRIGGILHIATPDSVGKS